MIENLKDNPGALIIDGHGTAELGVVRALGRAGVPVFLASNDPKAPARYSRYVKQVFDYPPDRASDVEKVSRLRNIGRRFRHKPVLFATDEANLCLLSRCRTALEYYFRHHMPEAELIDRLSDKRLFAQLAGRNHLPVPTTVVPKTRRELEASLWGLRFPVVVKPAGRQSWAAQPQITAVTGGRPGGYRLNSIGELLQFYDKVARFDPELVVQEYIDGGDAALYQLHVYIDRLHQVKGWGLGQTIRSLPPRQGAATALVTCNERAIYRLGISALHALGVTGQAVVRVKWSPAHRSYLIMGMSARHGAATGLYLVAGVNLPSVAYRDSLGREVSPLAEQLEGVHWVDAEQDRLARQRYRALGEGRWGDSLRGYSARRCYACFSWRDPLPALARWWARWSASEQPKDEISAGEAEPFRAWERRQRNEKAGR